jgi:hypothetical protein
MGHHVLEIQGAEGLRSNHENHRTITASGVGVAGAVDASSARAWGGEPQDASQSAAQESVQTEAERIMDIPVEWIDVGSRITVVGVLIANIYIIVNGILNKKVVPWWVFEDLQHDRDRLRIENDTLRGLATRAQSVADRAITVIERTPAGGG